MRKKHTKKKEKKTKKTGIKYHDKVNTINRNKKHIKKGGIKNENKKSNNKNRQIPI